MLDHTLAPVCPPEPAPALVLSADDALFDRVLEQLHDAYGNALRDLALAAGRAVVDAFFAGDEQAFTDRNHFKTSKYADFVRARADQLEAIGLNAGTLRHYVHAWFVWGTLPPMVQDAVSLSALVELARLRDPVRRVQVAVQAHREAWTVRHLRAVLDAEVASLPAPEDPGAQPSAQLVRAVHQWQRQTARWQAEPAELAALARDDKAQVRSWIRDVRGRLREMEAALKQG